MLTCQHLQVMSMDNTLISGQVFSALQARTTDMTQRIFTNSLGALEARDSAGVGVLQMALYIRVAPFVAILFKERAVPDLWAAAAPGDARHVAGAIRANDGRVSGPAQADGLHRTSQRTLAMPRLADRFSPLVPA